jgi:hypothetical protein
MAYQWDYSKNIPSGLTVAQLDNIANTVFNPAANTNVFSRILSCILLAAAVGYVIARDKIVSSMQQLAMQQYQAGQTQGNQGEVNNQNPPGAVT